jgi:hypothetical protein
MGRRLYSTQANAPIDVGPAVTVVTTYTSFTDMSVNNDLYYAPIYNAAAGDWKFAAAGVNTVDVTSAAGTGPVEAKKIPLVLKALADAKIPPFLVMKLGPNAFTGATAHLARLKDKNNADLSDENTGGTWRWYPARIIKGPKDYLPLGDSCFGTFATRLPTNQLLCFAHRSICYTGAPLKLLKTVSSTASTGGIPVHQPDSKDTTVPGAIKNMYSSFGYYFGAKTNPTLVLNACFMKQPSRALWYLYDDGDNNPLNAINQTVMLKVPITPFSYYMNNSVNAEGITLNTDAYELIMSPANALDTLLGLCIDPESDPNDAFFKIFGNAPFGNVQVPQAVDLSKDIIQAICDAKITSTKYSNFCPSLVTSAASKRLVSSESLKPVSAFLSKTKRAVLDNCQMDRVKTWWPWFVIVIIIIAVIVGVAVPFIQQGKMHKRAVE